MDFDFDSHTNVDDPNFTIGISKIMCVETRQATNEIGGFAQYSYLAEDEIVIVNRTHRFSLRQNRQEVANCFVSTTEIYVALANTVDVGENMLGGEYQCITFSETEDPRIVNEGDPLFAESPDILQISADCKLVGDHVEMRHVRVYHKSLFILNRN